MWILSGFADEIDPDLSTQCSVLDQLGIRYIELRSAWNVNVLDLTGEQVAEVERVLAEHGIRVSSIGSPLGKINIEDDFDAHLARADRAVQVARRLAAPFIRVFSFFLTAEQRPEDYRDKVIGRMSALAERASAGGVILLHENEKGIFGDVPDRVHDIVTTVDSPALRLAWDAANYVQCGVVPFPEAYELLRPYTDYIQIKDAVLGTGEVVPAGEGDGRIRDTMRAFATDGFDGFVSMEPHLASAHELGGFSGADNFIRATKAFTAILDTEGIAYR
jgi:sugar phosphate isomerase/epimerase